MSHTGKLLRGQKWCKFRNLYQLKGYDELSEGIYMPNDILKDLDKMEDVTYYLNFLEGKDATVVDNLLKRIKFVEGGITNRGLAIDPNKRAAALKNLKDKLKALEEPEAEPEPEVDLTTLTKAELQTLCIEQNIEYTDSMTKAELIELLGGN